MNTYKSFNSLHFKLCSLWLLMVISHGRSSSLDLERSTYIVHMDKSLMPSIFTSHHHWYATTIDSLIKSKPPQFPSNGPDSSPTSILYSYDNALHGFSAVLSVLELESLKKTPGFVSAYADKNVVVDTTRTVDFLSLNTNFGLWPASDYGDDVIIGVIDSGVWPESKSFKDDGMKMAPQKQSKWKGKCEAGEQFNSSMCNHKLIGASYFNKGLKAAKPRVKITMDSPRDTNGHGTHTASTAAGNYVNGVSFFGYAEGTARGVAPRARLAIYKVVWDEGSYASDVLAAMDQALDDGVDVISMSLGFDELPLYEDPVAIGSFAAMEKGVLVSLSAGNGGPSLGSVHNGIPWALTAAASTIDRQFAGTLTLGNGHTIVGWTMFPASAVVQQVSLLYNKSLASCDSSNELAKAPYSIIICDNTGHTDDQMQQIAGSNAAASIFISDDPKIFEVGGVAWPGIVISPKDGEYVIKYATTDRNPWASMQFQQTFIGSKPAPAVAFYTSRGPSPSYPGILKPDLMAPGSQVLAAYIPNSYAAMIGTNIMLSNDYVMLSGTSMACPHATGVASLLKNAHPEWSPAAIRSAMMTTANTLDNTGNPIRDNGSNSTSIASPLAMGSGQIDPNRALDPGLVYDATQEDYMNLICSMNLNKSQVMTITRSSNYSCSNPSADLNYPSFIALHDNKTATKQQLVQAFRRTVSNVGEGAAVYKAVLAAPEDCKVRVNPKVIAFKRKYEKQSYTLRVVCGRRGNRSVSHGSIVWVEVKGKRRVRSPIVVASLDDA
ncbi:hypothetical protein V2J09_007513 [Rumex salicifolius]